VRHVHSVVVLGGSGLVGSRAVEMWTDTATVIAPTHAQLDVLNTDALATFLRGTDAPVVVNLAAWADVDGAEPERGDEHGRVYGLNAIYPATLARLCGDLNKHLAHVSTDYVFDGANGARPYVETDAPNPLSWYASTKREGERRALETGTPVCVARIEMPFTARHQRKADFARMVVNRLGARQPITCVSDQRITPVFLDDALSAVRILVEQRHTGIIHVAGADWTTPFRFAHAIARRLQLDADLIRAEQFENFANTRPARRPQHSWLDVSLFAKLYRSDVLRPLEAELDTWVQQLAYVPRLA
jgi:dTDP-4-dehydrorhamnose reductase